MSTGHWESEICWSYRWNSTMITQINCQLQTIYQEGGWNVVHTDDESIDSTAMYEREEVCAKWRSIRGPSAGSPSGKRNWAAFTKAYKTAATYLSPLTYLFPSYSTLLKNLSGGNKLICKDQRLWRNRNKKVTLDLLQIRLWYHPEC